MSRKQIAAQSSLPRRQQAGMTLIETVIALAMLFIAAVGIMSVAVVATQTTENQGHLAARTAEYAQDKMEQLIGLSYGDSQTDTTVFPSAATGVTGLIVGGSSDPEGPVTGYVDYLDVNGNPLALGTGGTAPTGWYYIRVWEISNPAGTSNMKKITVSAKTSFAVGSSGAGILPHATIASLKTNPF